MSRIKNKAAAGLALALSLTLFSQNPNMVAADEGLVSFNGGKWAIIPEFASVPTIDGLLTEGEWGDAATLNDFRTAYFMQPVMEGPSYQVGYDKEHLYIGGTLAGTDVTELRRIEVVLATDARDDVAYVGVIPISDPARPLTTNWNLKRKGKTVPISGIRSERSVGASSMTFEASIPLNQLGLAPSFGSEWRLNMIHVYDINTKPLISWVPIQKSRFWVTSGSYQLQGNVVDHGRLGSIYFGGAPNGKQWQPERATLEYVSFNEKRLSFESIKPARTHYELKWKHPGQPWQVLSDVAVSRKGSRTELTFTHPDPLGNGQYQLQLLAYTKTPADGALTVLTFDREGMIAAGRSTMELPSIPTYLLKTLIHSSPTTAVQETMKLIPDRNGFRYVGLPDNPALIPDGLYELSPDGQRLIAKSNRREYPNDDYPEDKVMIVKGKNGQDISYPYYEAPDGKMYFMSAHKWYLQRNRALSQMVSISETDPLGAARLLYEFAMKSENYVPTSDERWSTYPLHMDSGPAYNYWGGLWSRWSLSELGSGLKSLSDTLISVNKTNALDVLGQELGVDVRKKIIEEMLLPAYAFTQSFPVNMGNQDYANMRGMVSIGKALNDPDYIHHAVDWISQWIDTKLLADGFYPEITLSYHSGAINGLQQAINSLIGYNDPAGYVSPRTGDTYNKLNLGIQYPIVSKSAEILKILTYPDGKYVPLQDTWANTRSSSPVNTASLLLPSSGVGKMTLGQSAGQTQVYMTFGPKLLGHNHYDPLNLILYAEGQELLPDIGYTNTSARSFLISTLGHNTVTVDGSNMSINEQSELGGAIETFVSLPNDLTVMRADQKSAYAQTTEYSREPWLIPFDDGGASQGYVLDIFRVAGGTRHEYTLQGDANREAEFVTPLPLTPHGATLQASGEAAQYGRIIDVDQAELASDRYEVMLVTRDGGKEAARLNIIGLLEDHADDANKLYLGRAPSIRESRLKGSSFDNNTPENATTMPKLVHRREGKDLSSTFLTVLEPFQEANERKINSMERLMLDTPMEGAVAVKVVHGNTTDIILSNPRHPEAKLTIGNITMSGELGFIRLVDDKVAKMYLIGGTLLQMGDKQVTGKGTITGTISGTKRLVKGDPVDGLVTSTPVPQDAVGKYVVVRHPDETTHAYKIGGITVESGQTTIVLESYDPSFEFNVDGTTEWKYFPNTFWASGKHTFRIADVVTNR